ncbi:cohesin subunit SA-1 [Cydia amplana]|uniref:cohesin subunit SA-1 n=1 Tax=Cydia amplana TaxID=1869771 RepID=UPI002FE5AB53
MHRRGGKRIRMDDPPPEYVNPMTPATPMTDYGGQSVHEPETPNVNYSGFNVGTVANSTAVEPPREEEDSHHEEDDMRSPSPAPTKRVTRSRGRGGDGGYVGRLAESPPPPPLRPRRGRGGRGRGRGRGAPPPPSYSPPPMLLPGDDENSLYNILRFNKTAINQVVDLWIEQYKSNREHALVQLMQFFINSSGCRGKVTPDMAQMDHTLIIKKMTQEFDEESGEYPLIMSGQTWKKFRANFCEFIQTLVKMCQYSIIYDQYLMDNIISLLTGLSDSQVRAFRHTATLAVMKLMTALVDVALLTSVNCDNCLRQYEAERLKARDKRASERLEVLVAKRQELEENMEEIKNMLSYMFKSVFVHRYRDTLPDIRAITMAEIGIWMEKFPAHFLDDLYLKYIGWTLHDKVGEVRLRCLQALQPLYECEELKGKLELFTSKFKDRIVAMSLDKETDVAVHAVRLVIAILKMHPDVLTDKDCENVYELVYSSTRQVAAAAGEFLNVRLFRAEPPPAAPPRSRRGKERLPNTPLIRDLVQFFIESELHEHGAYLVDSLIESNPMMKDWECMTDLLLEEPGPGEEALDNRQESSLIELMVCCVRQAASGEPPVGRGASRKHVAAPSKEQAKAVADDRARLTQHFIAVLPALLDKFGADAEKLANLVAIPMHFERSLYCTARQETALRELLARLKDIVGAQTEAEVLETAGRTLEYLCEAEGAAARQCAVARATITDMCVNRYKEAIDEYRSLQQGGEEPDADETFNVVNSLRKVSIMYMCHDLNNTNIWDSLFEDLPKCLKPNEMPAQALVYVVRCLFYSVLWSLHELEQRAGGAGAGAGSVEAGAAALRERLQQYAALCKDIVARGVEPQLREEAYTSLCDLLIFFAEQLGSRGSPALRPLVLEPDPELCDLLNDFIQEFVFVQHNYDGQDERRIEELHKRRNFLAAYCKLIVYNVTPIRRAADVFKHYIKCYNDYGDIIKATLSKAREINKLSCALTMQLAMQALYTTMLQRHATPHRQLPELLELKELAKRFSVMFGLDAVKNREALTALHRAGVGFAALEPRNLLFLEPLAELSNKLLRQDKRHVLKFLDAKISAGAGWGEEWAPLQTYRGSLLTDAQDERPPPARRHYARKNRGQDAEEEGDEHNDSDGEQAGRKRRRLRLPVSHRRTSLPRIRRASRTPTPATTPSLSIDEGTPRLTPTPARRSRRLVRASEFEQDSDASVLENPSPTKSDTSRKDSNCELGGAKRSKPADQVTSPSKESETSRKDSSDGPIRGVNVTKRIIRHESDTSEVGKGTSPSKGESDTSRKDSTSDTRDENITKRSVQRQNIATELEKPLKESDISRKNTTSDTKDANVSNAEWQVSDSSEVVEKVISYSNYESDASHNSNRTIENINVTRRGQNRYADASKFNKNLNPTLNEDSEESRSDSVSDTTFKNTNVTIRGQNKRCTEKHVYDVAQLKKRSFTSDGSQNNSASDTGVKHGNVTIRGQKYGERPDAGELTKRSSMSSEDSSNGSVSEEAVITTVTIRGQKRKEKQEDDDELVKKLSSLFNEGSDASDTIARGLNVTTRAPKATVNENSTADESNIEKSLLVDKDINATICAPKLAADKDNCSANSSTSEDDNTPTSPQRSSNKLEKNLGSLAPRRRRTQAGVVEFRRNAKITRTDDSFTSPDRSVRISDQSLGSLAPRRHLGVVEYRRNKMRESANTTRLDHSLESSKESDDHEQNIGIIAPLKPRPLRRRLGVIAYGRNSNATTMKSSLMSEIEVQSSEQTVVAEVTRRAVVIARADVDRELLEYEQALRPRRAGVQYKRGGNTAGVAVLPKPKRMRMDSDTDSQDENG